MRSGRGGARGGARTMRGLWATLILAATAQAAMWTPPPQPLFLNPQHILHKSHSRGVHHIHIHGWKLELQENTAIKSPYYNECKFYKGLVLNEDESTVTVTECAGLLYGLLQVRGEEFVLQPTKVDSGHVLRRRDVLEMLPIAHDLTGDTVEDLELDWSEEEARPHVHARHSGHDDHEYFRDAAPITRPVSGSHAIWLEMAIVADHTMLKFHGRERVEHYILALMNIVSAIFNDESLGSNMTLIINKLYMEKDPVIKYGNARKTLESVNKWNYKHLSKLPAETTGWDTAVWLTRSPLGGPSGFAPVGGVCSKTRSAAIIRDEGLTSAFVIAHELGHLLGLVHDGEAQCVTALRRSVMARTVLATLHNYTWSNCSRDQFHEKTQKWWCLQERSQDEGVVLGGGKELSFYVFTMDEQCRTEFGEGFSVCKSVRVRSACSRLWCAHRSMPHVCHSKRAPPLEGTPCGRNRWCVHRTCEPMPGFGDREDVTTTTLPPLPPAKPEWGQWADWTPCSATCGYGLRTRSRRCYYKGLISETACEGAASQTATCWADIACAGPRDVRADICVRHNVEYIPYIPADDDSKQCDLSCIPFTGGQPVMVQRAPDGAPCSYERPYDICYQGTCVRGQCNSTDPICNWCPDGYCNNNTHIDVMHLIKGWTRMAFIPHGAHMLSIHISTPLPLHIAIRERKKESHYLELSRHNNRRFDAGQNNYLKYDRHVPQNLQIVQIDSNVIDIKEDIGWEGHVVAAGSVLRWRQTDSDIYINATARLQTDLTIMAIPEYVMSEDLLTVEVSVNYSTPERKHPLKYRCGYSWRTGDWEECSATCGDDGIQERQLFCLPNNIRASSRESLIQHSVSPALCCGSKPGQIQACNRLPCPVYWEIKDWTACSTTCGRGVSVRPLYCPAPHEALCGPKPRQPRKSCRIRKCLQRPRPIKKCRISDASNYCELFTSDQLKRNCVIPRFRKYCCNACRSVDNIDKRGTG